MIIKFVALEEIVAGPLLALSRADGAYLDGGSQLTVRGVHTRLDQMWE